MALKQQKDGENPPKQPDMAQLPEFEDVAPQRGLIDTAAIRGLPDGPILGTIVPKLGPADITELLRQRAAIDAQLPATKLSDMDLETEVVLQYQQTKALLMLVLGNDSPANQKAQVANSCASVLDQLIKMQARLYGAERIKAIEAALIKTLKTLPTEQQEAFLTAYERAYQPEAA